MNSSRAMPISVTLVSCSGSLIRPQTLRPDQRAGDDIAERRAEPQAAEERDEDQRRAEHDRAALEDRGRRLGGLGGTSSSGGLDRRQQRAERQQDRAMARLAPPRRRERIDAGPVARLVLLARRASG